MSDYPKRSIYLAGPITGLTYKGARFGWREEFIDAKQKMGFDHISCFSPMRGKDMLEGFGILTSGADYPEHAMTSSSGITTRDLNDVKFCDVVVGCFLESQGLSLGTGIEYGAAWALQKPVVAVGPADEVNIKHLMAQHIAGFRVDTIEEAVIICGYLLTPGV